MIRVVSVKFRDAGRLYDFDAGDLELPKNEQVVVETERGRALGLIVVAPREVALEDLREPPKKVLRTATDEDLAIDARYKEQEQQAFKYCRSRIEERGMEMKLVRAEYLFEGSKIVFYFTADGRVDFRELVKDLAHHLHTRIEMRQIGVRDEAKLLGGVGVCGRELCCCTFLREFNPVSVKMAKEQGLALNPGKISGQCGRLLCCLGYEYETYCHLKRSLPKIGRIIKVGDHEAMVLSLDIFAGKARVRLDNGKEAHLSALEIERGEMPAEAEPTDAEAVPERQSRRVPTPPKSEERQKKQTPPTDEKDKDKSKEQDKDQRRQATAPEQKTKRKRRGRSSRGKSRKKDEASQSGAASPGAATAKEQSSGKQNKPRPDKSAKPESTSQRGPEQKDGHAGKDGQTGQPEKTAKPRTSDKKRRPRRRPRKKDQ